MSDSTNIAEADAAVPGAVYDYANAKPNHAAAYLWPILRRVIEMHRFTQRRAFDLGCGNGATSAFLTDLGFAVIGVDPSRTGIAIARESHPPSEFFVASSHDDLAARFGTFPLVVSLDVISFVLDPVLFAQRVAGLLEPQGVAVVATPYHGYWKNLVLSLTDKWDKHLDPFWQGTLTRFFSEKTYRRLWTAAGFDDVRIIRVGRVPALAKDMVAILRKS